jgi:hypothetical protein
MWCTQGTKALLAALNAMRNGQQLCPKAVAAEALVVAEAL